MNTLHLDLSTPAARHAAYLPFITHGGLFINTPSLYSLAQELACWITLKEGQQPIPCRGKVVWITPPDAQNNQPTGIGIQLMEASADLRAQLEELI